MTHAIRETVRDYSRQIRPTPRRPFSESHIVRNIRSRQLSTVSEEPARSPLSQVEGAATADGDDTEDSVYSISSTNEGAPSSRTSLSDSIQLKPATDLSNYPDPESITADTLTAHMYTADAPPVDLLVRTSGVHRLSDFLLWQCHEHTSIVFLECLWPAFDLWQFLPVLVEWQWKQRERIRLEAATSSVSHRRKVR